ncbi:MAG: aldehyde dehydrogenase family protein, partial [Planctomycetota bacterium]
MVNTTHSLPAPTNEPIREYRPGTDETARLQERIDALSNECPEIPCIVSGRELTTGRIREVRCPHDHGKVLARYHEATPEVIDAAVEGARVAWREWSETPWEERLAIFRRAADLLAGPRRALLNAATMLGQSKNAFQAEIDSACELIDFWRFNVHYAWQLYAEQPESGPGMWNAVELRPLEGFVF